MILVETISVFRMRYLVDESNHDYAKDTVLCNTGTEFTQKHLDEIITSTREVTLDEAKRIYAEDNSHPLSEELLGKLIL